MPLAAAPSACHLVGGWQAPLKRARKKGVRVDDGSVVVFPFGLKAMLDGTLAREAARESDQHRILDELARKFGAAPADTT
jgi:hypothetical protein